MHGVLTKSALLQAERMKRDAWCAILWLSWIRKEQLWRVGFWRPRQRRHIYLRPESHSAGFDGAFNQQKTAISVIFCYFEIERLCQTPFPRKLMPRDTGCAIICPSVPFSWLGKELICQKSSPLNCCSVQICRNWLSETCVTLYWPCQRAPLFHFTNGRSYLLDITLSDLLYAV